MKSFVVRLLPYLLLAPAAYATPERAIVGLYVTLHTGGSEMGTGFFTSNQGQIVTAYHVVHGARKIKVITTRGETYDAINVVSVAPERDLAVLQLLGNPQTPDYLSMVERVPHPHEELTIIGYPRGLPNQFVRAHSTSSSLISSLALKNSRGRRLFATDLEVLPLDVTVYSGMSGAPVITPYGVAGVLSGSFDEGGAIAWMLPTKHRRSLRSFDRMVGQISQWPRFGLMLEGGFRSLRRQTRVDSTGERLLEAYLDSVETYSSTGERLGSAATKLKSQIMVSRNFFKILLTDDRVTKDKQTVQSFLKFPFRRFQEELDAYGKAHEAFSGNLQEFGNRGFELVQWVENRANYDREAQTYLASIEREFTDFDPRAYYQRVGAGPEQVTSGVTQFSVVVAGMSGGYSRENIRLFARGMLDLMRTLESHAVAHASPRAFSVMRQTVANYRRIATAFEPVVYRQ